MSVIKQLAKKEINKGLTNTKQSILIDVFIRSAAHISVFKLLTFTEFLYIYVTFALQL